MLEERYLILSVGDLLLSEKDRIYGILALLFADVLSEALEEICLLCYCNYGAEWGKRLYFSTRTTRMTACRPDWKPGFAQQLRPTLFERCVQQLIPSPLFLEHTFQSQWNLSDSSCPTRQLSTIT